MNEEKLIESILDEDTILIGSKEKETGKLKDVFFGMVLGFPKKVRKLIQNGAKGKCMFCGQKIKVWEREPNSIFEKIESLFGKKFFETNCGMIYPKGFPDKIFVCDDSGCMMSVMINQMHERLEK